MATIEDLLHASTTDFDKMSIERKRAYFMWLRNYCKGYNMDQTVIAPNNDMIEQRLRCLYNFNIINFRNFEPSLIVCNHSNPRDLQTMFFASSVIEHSFQKKSTFLGFNEDISKEGIKSFSKDILTLMDRTDEKSIEHGFYSFIRKFMNTDFGIAFGEPVLNFNPVENVIAFDNNVVKIAVIAEKPIIPCAIQYVELPEICEDENRLYCECNIRLGEPIKIDAERSLSLQAQLISQKIASLREDVKRKCEIEDRSIDEVSKELYVNHTYLKSQLLKKYCYEDEMAISSSYGGIKPVMYTMNEHGLLVPGQIKEETFRRTLSKK